MQIVLGNKTYSSWSLRGWLAVKASGLAFEEIVLRLRTDDFRDRIGALSPTGLVPCLIDGETSVWDSLAIIDYLDRKAPQAHFWPNEISAYGMARSVAAEMHSGYQALRQACPYNLAMDVPGFKPNEATRADVARISELWLACRARFGESGPYLFGAWSAADMMFAPVVGRFQTYGLSEDPTVLAYMEAVHAHPHMLEWIEAARSEAPAPEYGDLPQGVLRDGFRG